MEAALFFLAAIGALGGAVGVIAMRNPFYSVLALIVHLFALAVLFLLPFEASSILLLLAAVGAVVLAGRNRGPELKEGASPSSEHSAPKARSEDGLAPSPTQGLTS